MSTALDISPCLGADIVKASWRRCLTDYGLDRAMRKPIERVGQATVRDLRGQMEDVLTESSPVIERVRRIAADTEQRRTCQQFGWHRRYQLRRLERQSGSCPRRIGNRFRMARRPRWH